MEQIQQCVSIVDSASPKMPLRAGYARLLEENYADYQKVLAGQAD